MISLGSLAFSKIVFITQTDHGNVTWMRKISILPLLGYLPSIQANLLSLVILVTLV
jgi:hypothetical protein